MRRTSLTASKISVGSLFIAALFSCSGFSCSRPEKEDRTVLVFVEARSNSQVNAQVIQRFLLPIIKHLDQRKEPYQLEMFPLSANAVGNGALFSAAVRDGRYKNQDRAKSRVNFGKFVASGRINQVYRMEDSELVDVLGSIPIIDSSLGEMKNRGRGGNLDVVYVSGLVQSNGLDGYDFTGFFGGKSLEMCKKNLEIEYGEKLQNRAEFSKVRVLALWVDFPALYTELGVSTRPAPPNISEILNFWRDDAFGGTLVKAKYYIDRSGKPDLKIAEFLE